MIRINIAFWGLAGSAALMYFGFTEWSFWLLGVVSLAIVAFTIIEESIHHERMGRVK